MATDRKEVTLFPSEKHLVDYQETLRYFHDLASTRFKLLAIVPSFTGLALATLLGDSQKSPSTLIAVGAFGFLVVFGVIFYDVRNTHIYDAMQLRAKNLEVYLGLPWALSQYGRGGPLLGRPPRSSLKKLFGIFEIWHDRGLAIVYSSCLAAWLYLTLWGIRGLWLKYLDTTSALRVMLGVVAVIVPAIFWMALIRQYEQWDTATDLKEKLTPWAQSLVDHPSGDLGFDERSGAKVPPNTVPPADG